MDNLSYISFICLLTSLGLMLPLIEKKARSIIIFVMIGIFACLFASELNNILLQLFDQDLYYVTTTITPISEEIIKALPILYFAIVISDDRRSLIENAFAIGVGFALLENMVILVNSIESVTIPWALIRSFGAGLMHGICTVMVGYGISYIRKRKKIFYCGTFALLAAAIIYHATYNMLVQSQIMYAGVLLPLITYIPGIILITRQMKKKHTNNRASKA